MKKIIKVALCILIAVLTVACTTIVAISAYQDKQWEAENAKDISCVIVGINSKSNRFVLEDENGERYTMRIKSNNTNVVGDAVVYRYIPERTDAMFTAAQIAEVLVDILAFALIIALFFWAFVMSF